MQKGPNSLSLINQFYLAVCIEARWRKRKWGDLEWLRGGGQGDKTQNKLEEDSVSREKAGMREQLRCCKISSQGYGVEKECCGLVCSYTQQSSDHHYTVQTSCDVYKFSFWPRAINDWNSLPPNIILDMDSTDSFELAANSFSLHLADLQTHCLF